MSTPAPVPGPAPAPTPVDTTVIPTDGLGRIKYFLQVDGQDCEKESRDNFATFLIQSGFTTVTKPGSCPSGTKQYSQYP